jgi:hypothetical protein
LLATPYGVASIDYYRSTLFNSQFGKLISEWLPVTATTAFAIPYLLMLVAAVWSLGRSGRRTPAFDQSALMLLGTAGVIAVRNVVWFGLAAVVLMPGALAAAISSTKIARRRPQLNVRLAVGSIAVALLIAVATASRPASWFQSRYDSRVLAAVARLAAYEPRVRVLSDVAYSDWLLWYDPQLDGRIGYDTRFELLTSAQLEGIDNVAAELESGGKRVLAGYGVVVLDPRDTTYDKTLLARSGVRVVLRTGHGIVATLPAR